MCSHTSSFRWRLGVFQVLNYKYNFSSCLRNDSHNVLGVGEGLTSAVSTRPGCTAIRSSFRGGGRVLNYEYNFSGCLRLWGSAEFGHCYY